MDTGFTTNAIPRIVGKTVKLERKKGVGRVLFDLKWRLYAFLVKHFTACRTEIIVCAEFLVSAYTATESVKTRFFIVAPKERDYRDLTEILSSASYFAESRGGIERENAIDVVMTIMFPCCTFNFET